MFSFVPFAAVKIVETSTSSLHRLIDEDDEPIPSERQLIPRKRRSVNIGDKVTKTVDSLAGDFSLLEMATIVIGDGIELESGSPRLEVAEVGLPLVEKSVDDAFKTSRREKASTSQPTADATLLTDERGKTVADDIDAAYLKIMEEGFIQLGT